MPIRRSQKKRNAEPRQKQNHRSVVIDPMVNPGSSADRHQARSRADPTRTHHRMVTMAQSSPGDRSACAPQSKTTTVMLERDDFSSNRHRALSFCLSMISAQTRSAFVARENRYPPIGSWPEGMLFRIML